MNTDSITADIFDEFCSAQDVVIHHEDVWKTWQHHFVMVDNKTGKEVERFVAYDDMSTLLFVPFLYEMLLELRGK